MSSSHPDPTPCLYNRFWMVPLRANLEGKAESSVRHLHRLLKQGATERELDKFMRRNPVILEFASRMFSAGHHGCLGVPQFELRQGTLDGVIFPIT